jgi:trans-2,3-dihydro-3-hydroxyanthranilate isomerase
MPQPTHYLLDVFTDQPFGGNPLAVFRDGTPYNGEMMQKIAKEFNLSEVTFLLPPEDPDNDYKVRIFTPGRELPMAGHPTVGTAHTIFSKLLPPSEDGEYKLRLEEGVGVIPVTVHIENGKPGLIIMEQPQPKFGEVVEDRRAIAEMLSLAESDLMGDYPVQVVSCGVPFLLIPIARLESIKRARLRLDLWEKIDAAFPVPQMFLFTRQTEHSKAAVHSRMFAPGMGIAEDPATGAASGPLGSYLVQYGLAEGNSVALISEQGMEMGRPSFIHIWIEKTLGEIASVKIGGTCVEMGEGILAWGEGKL